MICGLFAVAFATGALAHSGVKNPVVMQRMMAMEAIVDAMQVLKHMAKGKTAFDQEAAQAALAEIKAGAVKTPSLFEAEEDDPKSEARPEIWTEFADFTEKSRAMEIASERVAPFETLNELQEAVTALDQTCRACHQTYRE